MIFSQCIFLRVLIRFFKRVQSYDRVLWLSESCFCNICERNLSQLKVLHDWLYTMCMYYTRDILGNTLSDVHVWFHPQEVQASRSVARCTNVLFLRLIQFAGSFHGPTSTSTIISSKMYKRLIYSISRKFAPTDQYTALLEAGRKECRLQFETCVKHWKSHILVQWRFWWWHFCRKTNICPTQFKMLKEN